MKKQLLIFSAMCGLTYGAAIAQISIPNGNFESWTSGTYNIPQNYVQSSNMWAFYMGLPFNEVQSTDPYHGLYSVQLTTEISANNDTVFAYFINTNPNGNPASWHGGFPYSQKPTGIRGYYKSSVASPDTARVGAFFYLGGNLIGQYVFPLYGTHSTYTLFSFAFNPALPFNPDTVVFAAASSDFIYNNLARNGSMLKIDSVSFTGVSSQPALFNGDFELWQTQTLNKPNNWYLQGGGGNSVGVFQTTDKVAGNYAVEIITQQGDNNGVPRASAGRISTGYYLNNCSGPNCQKGGYPFSNQTDTLVFSYKYVPMNADSADVSLTFKKNGSPIFWANKNLGASPSYQIVSVPFNAGQIPDTVVVLFQSSLWQDTALSFIGSDLKVDEVHFKSQPLNTGVFELRNNDQIVIYPNPTNGKVSVVVSDGIINSIEIYDVPGNIVENKTFENSLFIENLDLSKLNNGLYLMQVNTKSGVYRRKLSKVN